MTGEVYTVYIYLVYDHTDVHTQSATLNKLRILLPDRFPILRFYECYTLLTLVSVSAGAITVSWKLNINLNINVQG